MHNINTYCIFQVPRVTSSFDSAQDLSTHIDALSPSASAFLGMLAYYGDAPLPGVMVTKPARSPLSASFIDHL